MNDKIREKVNELNALLLEARQRGEGKSKLVLVAEPPHQKIEVVVCEDGIFQEKPLQAMVVARNAADDVRNCKSHVDQTIRARFGSRPIDRRAGISME